MIIPKSDPDLKSPIFYVYKSRRPRREWGFKFGILPAAIQHSAI
jgi:hypothetical protein